MYAELTSSLSCGLPHIWKHCNTRIVYVEVIELSSHLGAIQSRIAFVVFLAFNFIERLLMSFLDYLLQYSVITCIQLLNIALFVGDCINLSLIIEGMNRYEFRNCAAFVNYFLKQIMNTSHRSRSTHRLLNERKCQ